MKNLKLTFGTLLSLGMAIFIVLSLVIVIVVVLTSARQNMRQIVHEKAIANMRHMDVMTSLYLAQYQPTKTYARNKAHAGPSQPLVSSFSRYSLLHQLRRMGRSDIVHMKRFEGFILVRSRGEKYTNDWYIIHHKSLDDYLKNNGKTNAPYAEEDMFLDRTLFPTLSDVHTDGTVAIKTWLDDADFGLVQETQKRVDQPFGDRIGRMFVQLYPLPHMNMDIMMGGFYGMGHYQDLIYNMLWGLFIGIVITIVFAFIAFIAGRFVGTKMAYITKQLDHLCDFDFNNAQKVPHSIVSEINHVSEMMNRLTKILSAFIRYVPAQMIAKIKNNHLADLSPVQKKVSVLFTDIAGFSGFVENLSAADAGQFLNKHFSLINESIVKYHGTVDKYIGDSVLAFWEEDKESLNKSDLALLAALSIQQAIDEENEKRINEGKKPVRIRIGVHYGYVLAGNIGDKNRINYTITGDQVNVAKRLEEIGKEFETSEHCIMVSDAIMQHVGQPFKAVDLGPRDLKGRRKAVRIFRLKGLG